MKKLSKEKRDRLVLVVIGALLAMGGLWFFLINPQRGTLAAKKKEIEQADAALKEVTEKVKQADQFTVRLDEATALLEQREKMMGPPNPYRWFVSTIDEFTHVYSQVTLKERRNEVVEDVQLLAKFPYKQATFKVTGTATYAALGRFIADFENKFPYMRVQNLQMDPDTSAAVGQAPGERLNFILDIVTLLKPSS